jgi:hypothetical protein
LKRWDIYNFKGDLELLRGNKAAVRKIAKHPQKVDNHSKDVIKGAAAPLVIALTEKKSSGLWTPEMAMF